MNIKKFYALLIAGIFLTGPFASATAASVSPYFVNPGDTYNNTGSASGNVTYYYGGLRRTANFSVNSSETVQRFISPNFTAPGNGSGSFRYSDSSNDWYNVDVQYVKVIGKDAWFAGPVVSSSQPSWRGQWLYAKVRDTGNTGYQWYNVGGFRANRDTVWGSFAPQSQVVSYFATNNLPDPSSGPISVSSGNLTVTQNYYQTYNQRDNNDYDYNYRRNYPSLRYWQR